MGRRDSLLRSLAYSLLAWIACAAVEFGLLTLVPPLFGDGGVAAHWYWGYSVLWLCLCAGIALAVGTALAGGLLLWSKVFRRKVTSQTARGQPEALTLTVMPAFLFNIFGQLPSGAAEWTALALGLLTYFNLGLTLLVHRRVPRAFGPMGAECVAADDALLVSVWDEAPGRRSKQR